jgi:hypothetical protein
VLGQFVFGTAESIGLSLKALLRNTERGDGISKAEHSLIEVGVKIFEDGALVYENGKFGEIPIAGSLELSAQTCPAMGSGQHDRVVVANCGLSSGGTKYFAQEHQLIYTDQKTGKFTHLLYDQRPYRRPTDNASAIIVLAPKMWVSREVNSYLLFANTWDTAEVRDQEQPLVVTILTPSGRILYTEERPQRFNSAWIFDVKKAIHGKLELTDRPQFLNAVVRGGASGYAITSFMKNEKTGNLSLEHSLPPPYYLSGAMENVRREALRL